MERASDRAKAANGRSADVRDPPPFATWERDIDPDPGAPVESLGALQQGQLVMDDRCLYVGGSLIVFPDDATWDEETQTVELDGSTAVVGEEVGLGGGEVGHAGLISSVPPGCDRTNAFQAFDLVPPIDF